MPCGFDSLLTPAQAATTQPLKTISAVRVDEDERITTVPRVKIGKSRRTTIAYPSANWQAFVPPLFGRATRGRTWLPAGCCSRCHDRTRRGMPFNRLSQPIRGGPTPTTVWARHSKRPAGRRRRKRSSRGHAHSIRTQDVTDQPDKRDAQLYLPAALALASSLASSLSWARAPARMFGRA